LNVAHALKQLVDSVNALPIATIAKKESAHSGTSTENNQYRLTHYRAKFYAFITK